MTRFLKNTIYISSFALTLGCSFVTPVSSQTMDRPWGFAPQNRASIAALMRQVETSSSATSATSAASQNVTSLVCGSDGSSSAKGNSSCIILNNATGDLIIGQDSVGNQDANSETTETTNVDETINVSGADDVLATLEGTD